MNENEIVHFALENLLKYSQINGKWETSNLKELDGKITLFIDNQRIKYNVEIKNELRSHQLQRILSLNQNYGPIMVIAAKLFPRIKEELRLNQIAYLEANGNIFLKANGTSIWIDAHKSLQTKKNNSSRAFTKTGLKVVFQFLLDDTWVNQTYRQIAEQTGSGIGNISNIISGLKQDGFLLAISKNQYKLNHKKELLNKWMDAYDKKLKPSLRVGTFRFLNENDFNNWGNLAIKHGKTMWGGEPAGDLYTKYLRPAELTLYTVETRNEIIKNYRLIPDENGNVKVYRKFWHNGEIKVNTVPPLLAYTDLMNTNDRRCTETAQKIYDEYLQNKL